MKRMQACLLLFVLVFAMPVTAARRQPVVSLPVRGLARMGTLSLRHGGPITALAFSPDGRKLASVGLDEKVRIWDVASGAQLLQISESWVRSLAFAPSGKSLATSSGIGIIRLWDAETGKEQRRFGEGHQGRVLPLAFSVDGALLASAGSDLTMRIWQVATGKELRRAAAIQSEIIALTFSGDGKTLASVSRDRTVSRWDVGTANLLRQAPWLRATAAVTCSADGKWLASACSPRGVALWDVQAGRELAALACPDVPVSALTFGLDGKALVVAGRDQTIHFWDTASARDMRQLHIPLADGAILAPSADGKKLAVASSQTCIQIWDLAGNNLLHPTPGHQNRIIATVLARNPRRLITGSADGSIRFWDPSTGKELRRIGLPQRPHAIVFSADGRSSACWFVGGTVGIWDLATGKESRRFQPATGDEFQCVELSRDGKVLATAQHKSGVRLIDASSGKNLLLVGNAEQDVCGIALSPDGQRLAALAAGEQIVIIDLTTGKKLHTLAGGAPDAPLLFSPNGRLLAAGCADGLIRLWHVATGREQRQFHGHANAVYALAFSPDGRCLLSGGDDGTVRLWEVATAQEFRQFAGHGGAVHALAFAADGATVASGSADTTAVIWDGAVQLKEGTSTDLTPKELEQLWAALATAEGPQAYETIETLSAFGRQAVPTLETGMRWLLGASAKRITQFIGELDNDDFRTREKAERSLDKLVELAEPALQQMLANNPSPEVRRRIERILKKRAGPDKWAQERLRVVRALHVLQKIGTAEARRFLKELAQGAPDAELMEEAQAALESAGR